ncbi:hypothetical protein ACN47E_008635 [Coniothyrium glycines]
MAPNAPAAPAVTFPAPSTPARDSSPELGTPSNITQYNKHTGRPMRRTAGKAKKVAGYVDSTLLDDDDLGSSTSELTEEEDDDDDMDMQPRGRSKKTKAKTKSKRKRSPSPPSPQLGPIIYNQEPEKLTDDETGGAFHRRTTKQKPLTLHFNVPLGFHGPLVVKLDSSMLHANEEEKLFDVQGRGAKRARVDSPSPAPSTTVTQYKGFLNLPPELRNKVYRHLFVIAGQYFRVPPSKNGPGLERSAQFLRTCKLVHNEGCSILYGENTFRFVRHFDTRGPFWERVPMEIGYQDALQFLKMIGAENLQYLRDIMFTFDDALPQHTPYIRSHEQRRYLNDEYLMNCLRILRNAKLRTFAMRFIGRRSLMHTDVKFLGYLEQIKADEVDRCWDHDFHYPPQKIWEATWRDLKEQMTRKKKLYEGK